MYLRRTKVYLSAVDPVLTTVYPVVYEDQVDLVFTLQIHLPPVVGVSRAMGAGSSPVMSIYITIYSSLRNTAPSN